MADTAVVEIVCVSEDMLSDTRIACGCLLFGDEILQPCMAHGLKMSGSLQLVDQYIYI